MARRNRAKGNPIGHEKYRGAGHSDKENRSRADTTNRTWLKTRHRVRRKVLGG